MQDSDAFYECVTDRPTDQPTDTADYRDARTHLKKMKKTSSVLLDQSNFSEHLPLPSRPSTPNHKYRTIYHLNFSPTEAHLH